MDQKPAERGASALHPAPNLSAAIRRARTEAAEHSEVVAEIRGAEMARLEMLAEAVKPVLAQVPESVDLFDAGLVPGDRPRFFLDMLAFVEMGRDRRTYHFIQDTRHGRVTLAESDKIDPMVETITAYIARRLVEREMAIASDGTVEQAARAYARGAATRVLSAAQANAAARPRPPRRFFFTALMFTIELLGAIVLFGLLAVVGYFAWQAGLHWWNLQSGG